MKRSIVFLSLIIALGFSLKAQIQSFQGKQAQDLIPSAAEFAVKDGDKLPNYVRFKEGEQPREGKFFEELKAWLELNEELNFKLRNSSEDELGQEHLHYWQTYASYKIDMAWLNLHLKDGRVLSFNGSYLAEPKADLNIRLSEAEALERALDDIGASTYKWEDPNEEEHLRMESGDQEASHFPKAEMTLMNSSLNIHEELQLCYQFNIYAQEPLGRYNYYVSATNGEIVYVESLIHTGDSPAKAVTAYSDTVTIITDSVGNYFRLREQGRGNGIETYDLNNGTQYSSAVDFIDSNNFWNNFTLPLDRYATDAHFGTEMTYDYFFKIHNRNSIDGAGFALKSYIRYNRNYVNAFWDGQRMTYGDGDATTSPLTTLDICGHEVTHGLTDFTSDLIYARESGALNESFSDIFGVAVEAYTRPNTYNWLVGEEIGGAIRSVSNPNAFGDPDTYGGQHWINPNCGPTSSGNDYCGVHTNSGVQNFWFYLLTTGGSGTNDIGQTYSVNGLGIIKAAKVAFRNNTIYLGRSSNHTEARFYAIRSAIDLFGACSPEVASVTNAWHAVGVGKPYSPGVSAEFDAILDTSFCNAPARVDFASDGSNAISFAWDFGDGNTSTQANPTHFYTAYGNYDVQLIVDGGSCGADTVIKSNYARVDSNLRCSYFLGTDRIVNVCRGTLYDNGGLNGDYGLNRRDTLEINPSNADQVLLFFDEFDIEDGDAIFCNRDYLEVYDGEVGSRIIGKYCGNNLPPDTIISSTNKLSLVFSSDGRNIFNGIRAAWECRKALGQPQADFFLPLDSICNPVVQFSDRSSGGVIGWQWDFGDGVSSNERNPLHVYENDGVYDVQLIVNNSNGSDTLLMNDAVVLQRLPAPSTTDDTACLGGRVKLAASGNGELQWFLSPVDQNEVFKGDTLRINNFTSDISFYVQYEQKPAAIIGSPFLISGNGYYSDTSEAMYFDVFEPMILESVILNSNRSGNRKIELRNDLGELIQSRDILVPSVASQVQLGFVIYPGRNYSLAIGSSNPSLYVNSTGASYPYTVGNLMELTGNSMGANAYPFFYYWTARPLSCFSQRQLVEGIVDTGCVIVDLDERSDERMNFSIYPNPSDAGFRVDGLAKDASNVRIEIYTLDGRLVDSRGFQNGTELQARSFGEALSPAVYFIRISSATDQQQFKWVKTR